MSLVAAVALLSAPIIADASTTSIYAVHQNSATVLQLKYKNSKGKFTKKLSATHALTGYNKKIKAFNGQLKKSSYTNVATKVNEPKRAYKSLMGKRTAARNKVNNLQSKLNDAKETLAGANKYSSFWDDGRNTSLAIDYDDLVNNWIPYDQNYDTANLNDDYATLDKFNAYKQGLATDVKTLTGQLNAAKADSAKYNNVDLNAKDYYYKGTQQVLKNKKGNVVVKATYSHREGTKFFKAVTKTFKLHV